ncbi:MAG: magnesium/cobalt transporter CorA [Cyanobacteria bacterium NC_groundwater_1444_Ag_S-0.65um_54_12]|nr:magnesium/cobalt transporter CorA [Cyanobacteria bacterium NC_groundwater_1444_Ag_S-0.65um_54_12]
MPIRVLVLTPEAPEFIPYESRDLLPPPEDPRVFWIDITAPTAQELAGIAERYGLHYLAIEDCLHDGQRPKLDSYDKHVFMVLHHPSLDRDRHAVTMQELDLFLGPNFVITSHLDPLPMLDVVRERWAESAEVKNEGASFLVYLIADTLVDDYFPVLDHLDDRLAELDDRIFQESDRANLMHPAFELKKQLLLLRRIVGPTRDSLVLLARHESPLLTHAAAVHIQDVYDHLIRIADTLDLYRDLASSVQETFLTMVSNRLNLSMKRLTAATITLMSISLVASIYGMNFRIMPELTWQHGYAWALGLMAAIGGGCLAFFKFRGYY